MKTTVDTMEDIIEHKDKFYILASSALADDRSRVLKHGNTFAVFDRYGDIQPLRFGEPGIYHSGTRYLSRLEFRINGTRPFLLSSSVLDDNTLLASDLTNPDFVMDGKLNVPRGTIHIFRSKFLWNAACYERFRLTNYGLSQVEFSVSLHFDNDFADIFEVRGSKRSRRGRKADPVLDGRRIILAYEGLDDLKRTTAILLSDTPDSAAGNEAGFRIRLAPHASQNIYVTTACEPENNRQAVISYDDAFRSAGADRESVRRDDCRIYTSNEQFNDWLNRSYADLHMMSTQLPEGVYPYAGVPWYSTVFGRDGIITALQYLWINPVLARGVLGHLAAHQATLKDPQKDAEPGKILHETRKGEMAALGEIPFGLYYGSIDVTPLFLILAGAYYERTNDIAFIRTIWPNMELALDWIEKFGDLDGDGFVEYARKSETGLNNQGWKDSDNSVFHANGQMAAPPIALCEVQAYVYDAYRRSADIASVLGYGDRAADLRSKADTLRERFAGTFWLPDRNIFALALDRDKKPCQVRSSNAGHCLLSGIASEEHAKKLGETLMSPIFFTGWGIRTIAAGEILYNPMEYHNGSIWPHDNAIIAAGLARYGYKEAALRILTGLFDASLFLELHRLPELFCGFDRRRGEGPTLYPVACLPQAWASSAPFLLLQSILGMRIDAREERVYFDHPLLPDYLSSLHIRGLKVGDGSVDLELVRHQNDVGINVTHRTGAVEVIAVK